MSQNTAALGLARPDFEEVEEAAHEFVAQLSRIEKQLTRSGTNLPSDEARRQVAAAYWSLFGVVGEFAAHHAGQGLSEYKARFRAIVNPFLGRSRLFWRSYAKPHGYAGDFKIIEWMYDLEHAAGEDITEPAIVNCLDYVFSTNHSVVSLWERRRWLRDLLSGELAARGALNILDVACGGARYLRDVLEQAEMADQVTITLVDQDPAAVNFATQVNLKPWSDRVTGHCAPIKHLPGVIDAGEYDVVISSGLFDYLDRESGQSMLRFLAGKLKPSGLLAITNYHRDDPSAITKEWCADWPLIFRDDHDVRELFPATMQVRLQRSENGSLIMATGKKEN